MESMARRFRLLLVGMIAIVATGLPVPAGGVAEAAQLEHDMSADAGQVAPATTVADLGATAIVPGSVNRTSVVLDATYDATLRLSWGTRRISVDSTAVIGN